MEFHIVVLLALVASAFAGPIAYRGADDRTSCAKQCTESNKFRYQPGTTYVYDYTVKTVTTMENAGSSSAVLLLSATAEVEVLSKCDMALSLRNTKLEEYGPDGRLREVTKQGALRRALEERPLRFAYQDGVLEGVCPSEDEDKWALNVKRGILSALQNSMDDISKPKTVQEDDVAGRCPVHYTPSGAGWYANSVKKSKDLLGCTDRNGLRSALQATPYRVPSEVQSLPLLKSSHECTQDIDSSVGFVRQTVCSERHVFRPFSRQGSGAATTVDQSLKFQSTRAGVRTSMDTVGRRASMYYEHAYAPGQENQGKKDAEAKLGELCRSTQNDIRPETPRLFAQLVQVLKALDVSTLRELYNTAKTTAVCGDNVDRTKKFFLDALPMTQTAAGVQLMTELLVNKEVTGLDADLYVTSLAIIQHPSQEMLQQVKALVESEDLSSKAMLPVTTLVNSYCQSQGGCDSDPAVAAIMSVLEKIIGSSCYVADKHLDKILLALRAAGNAGHSTSITSTLTRCLTRKSNPLEIRVSAVDAFRRQPCSADRSQLVSTFQDEQEDHELRITAYLAAMTCPSEELLNTVKQVLQGEGINQVTSFVWTHLSNLKETSSPHKQALRALVEDAKLKEEYSLASLKYSRNLEGSVFFEKVNMGAMVESNVIWSQDSYPRSGMVNLTVDLFGSSVNLLEVGGRLEGLDMLLESYLGPYGYFGDKTNKGPKKNLDDVHGSAYLRLFGNEMAFGHFKGMDAATSGSQFNMLEFLIDLSKDHDYKFSQSAVFMDTTLTVPTAGGLPLHLTVNGSASVDMVASGKLDLRKVATSPRSLTVDGSLQPSGAVEITSTMSVDGGVTSSGLRMVSTLHSSTALRGRIELQRGKVLKVEWDVPQEKMELLDVKSTFFTLHGNDEKEQDLITDNRKSIKLCSGAKLAKVSGLELCAEVNFPNASMKNDAPYFPFTGPVTASLSLFKRDSHSSYKLIAKRNENAYSSMGQLAFDTPGSAVDRALSFDVSLNYKKQEFDLSLLSPWTKVIFVSSVMNERREKSLAGKLTVNDKREYSVKAQLTQNTGKNENDDVWSPLVEIKAPSIKPVALTGSVLVRKGERLEVDLSLAGATDSPLTLKSTVINSDSEKSIDAVYNAGEGDYSMLASVDLTGKGQKGAARLNVKTPRRELVSFNGKADLRPGKSLKGEMKLEVPDLLDKPVAFDVNLRLLERGKGTRYQGQLTAVSQLVSGKVYGFMFVRTKGGVQSRLTVDYTVPRVARDKVTISGKFNDKSTKSLIKYIATANVALKRSPEYNLVASADFSHSKRHTEAGASLVFGKDAKTKVDRFDINASVKRKGTVSLKSADINFRGAMTYPPKGWNVQLKGSHDHDKTKVDSSVSLKYGKNTEASVALQLKDASKKLSKFSGSLKTMCPGNKMSLSSTLTQKNKRVYEHSLNLNWNKDSHSVKTTFKKDPRGAYSVDTDVKLEGVKPVSASVSSNLHPYSHKGDMALTYKGDKYEVKTSHKLARGNGKMDLEVTIPERRMTFAMDGGKDGHKYSGSMNADWDADKKRSNSRVKLDVGAKLESLEDMSANAALSYPDRDLTLNLNHKKKDDTYGSHADFSWDKGQDVTLDVTLALEKNKVSGDVALTTPFDGFGKMAAGGLVSEEKERYLGEAMASLGNKKLKTSLAVAKPVSLANLAVTWEASTPFYGWRNMDASLKHAFDNSLTTELKGSVGQDKAELTLTAANHGDFWIRRDMDASATFKSTIKGWEEVKASARHQDDGNRWTCAYQLTCNGEPYSLNVDLSAYRQGWQVESNGQILMIVPTDRMNVNWQHRNTANRMLTDVTANVGQGRVVRLSASGEHALTPATRKVTGSISLQSPWKAAEDMAFTFDHEHGYGLIRSTSSLKKQSKEVGSSQVNYIRGPGRADFDFTVKTPFTDDVTGNMNARYGDSPINGHAEVQWSRTDKLAVDGSLVAGIPFSATVRLTSPWQNMESVMAAASHKQEKGQWVSAARLDYGAGKTIEAKSTLGLGDHKMAALHVTTPFEQLRLVDASGEMSGDLSAMLAKAALNAEPVLGRYSSELSWKLAGNKVDGKARVDTPIRGFKYGQVMVAFQGIPLSGNGRVEIDYDRNVISLTSSHNFDQDADLEMTLLTPYQGFEFLNAKMTNDLTNSGLTSHAEFSYERYKKVEADLQGGWERDYSGSLTVRTPFSGYEHSSALFRHTGALDDFVSHAEGQALGSRVEADANFHYGWTSKAGASLKTTFPGWEKVVFSGESTGPWDNVRSSGVLEYLPGERVEGDLQFKFNPGKRIKAVVGLKAPFLRNLDFSLEQQGTLDDFNYKLGASYGRDYDFTEEMTFTMSKVILVKSEVSVKYPSGQHAYAVFFRHEGNLDSMNTQGSLSVDGKEGKMTSSFQMSPSVKGDLSIQTPFEGFSNIGLDFQHTGTLEAFNSQGAVRYMQDKTITGKASFSQKGLQQINGEVEVVTPFEGYRNSKVVFSQNGPWSDFKSHLEAACGSSDLNADANFQHSDAKTAGALIVTSFLPALKNMKLAFGREGTLERMQTAGSLQLNDQELVSGTLTHRQTAYLVASALNLKNIYTEDLSLASEYDGTLTRNTWKLSGSLGPDYSVEVNSRVNVDRPTITASSWVTYTIAGETDVGSITFKKEGEWDNFKMSTKASKGDKSSEMALSFENTDKVAGALAISTPVAPYHSVGASFQHSGPADNFNSEARLRYKDGEEMVLTGRFYQNQWRRVDATAQLTTPFRGLEMTKVQYTHTGDSSGFTCQGKAEYSQDQVVSGDLRLTYEPKVDFDLKVKTPFYGFEDMSASATYDGQWKRYSLDGRVAVGGDAVAAQGKLDYSASPMSASLLVTTPFRDFELTQLKLSHEGELRNFRSSADFQTPLSDAISGEVNFRYGSPTDLEVSTQLTSKIPKMESLKMATRAFESGPIFNHQIELGWSPEEEITLHSTFRKDAQWYQTNRVATLALTTPFPQLKSAEVSGKHLKTGSKVQQELSAQWNGKSVFDADWAYDKNDQHEVSMNMRQPQPMQVTATGNSGDSVNGDLLINWDRNHPESNVRVKVDYDKKDSGAQTDRNWSLKVIHPVRTVGVEGTFLSSPAQLKSTGTLILHERDGQKVWYELESSESSTYYRTVKDGSLKVGTPWRVLKAEGSKATQGEATTLEGALLWDAERSQDKKVGAKLVLTPTGRSNKADITLTLPSISKEFEIGSEVTVNQGRTLFNSKTEFSYSRDARKTLVLTSSLEDISRGYGSSNYSLSLGLTHAQTDVNVQVKGHAGMDNDKVTGGLDLQYLTSARQTKTVFLLGEIDKLRRQISVMMDTPVQQLQASGRVESMEPFKVKVEGRQGNVPFSASALVDPSQKTAYLRTTYDLDNPNNVMVLYASYYNESFIQCSASREVRGNAIKDAEMTVALTTPHLITSKATWRPTILQDIEKFLGNKLSTNGAALVNAIDSVSEAAKEELQAKYKDVSRAFKEELSELARLLEQEMADVSRELESAQRELRRLYGRNAFHLKDLGDVADNAYTKVSDALKQVVDSYDGFHKDVSAAVSKFLDDITKVPVGPMYDEVVDKLTTWLKDTLLTSLQSLQTQVASLDENVTAMRNRYHDLSNQIDEQVEALKNHPMVQRLRNSLPDYEAYVDAAHRQLQSLTLPEGYTGAIYGARDLINSGLSQIIDGQDLQNIQEAGNEVYQQAKWAYQYWQVEENLKEHIKSILRALEDILRDELKQYSQKLDFLKQTKVVSYNPQQGLLEVQVGLPLPMHDLQSLPDYVEVLEDLEALADKYLPSKQTIMHAYDKYVPKSWFNKTTPIPEGDMETQLQDYLNAPERRRNRPAVRSV